MKPILILFAMFALAASVAEPQKFAGKYCEGTGDPDDLRRIDDSFAFFHANPELPNVSMLYQQDWDSFQEGANWGHWWIQNSYGFSYSATPFLQEPWFSMLQRSWDWFWDSQGDGQRMGQGDGKAEPGSLWGHVAPDGCLGDAAAPGRIAYKQGDGPPALHDWFYEATAAGVVMQAEILLASRDPEKLAYYLPKMRRACDFIEKTRDPKNNLFLVGPGCNLLAPSYGGVQQPDGTFGKGYLAGLSITYLAALDRMVELFKLTGDAAQQAEYEHRQKITRESLPQLQAPAGYFVKSLAPDGTKHGVLGQEKFGYLDGVANADAMGMRVADDATSRSIYQTIRDFPDIRPFDFLMTNAPGLDDTYWLWGAREPLPGFHTFGEWVNGGCWGTVEGRAILGYYRVGAFEDIRRSADRAMKWAREFRMDAPFAGRGENANNPWSDGKSQFQVGGVAVMVDNFAIPAATVRGLFDYEYRADRLILRPRIPGTITQYTQKEPVRFGNKKILLSCDNGGPMVRSVTVNGESVKVESPDAAVLMFDQLPDLAKVHIITEGGWPEEQPPAATPATPAPSTVAAAPQVELPETLRKPHAVLCTMDELLAAEPDVSESDRLFVREAIAAIEAWKARTGIVPQGFFRPMTADRRDAIVNFYETTALALFNGFANRMTRYESSADPRKNHMARLFRQASDSPMEIPATKTTMATSAPTLSTPGGSALDARLRQTPSGPALTINGVPTAPVMFFQNMDTGPDLRPGQLRQIALAGNHGVNIVSVPAAVPWFLPGGEPDFTLMDQRMEEILKANPKALAVLRIGLSWPGAAHGYEAMKFSDGSEYSMPSIHGAAWRRDARAYLQAIVRHLEEKYPASVIGYHPCGQETGEWVYGQLWEGKIPGFEPSALAAFREWLKAKYSDDAGLRQAWGDGSVTPETATVPTAAQCAGPATGTALRDPKAERKAIDFFAFQNEAMADVAALMCQAAKEVAPNKLAITFYGYSFELSAAPNGVHTSGHLALRRILASPYVDALCGPVGYRDRVAGGGGFYMGPADSLPLHGKLWLVEDDTRTHHAKPPPPEIDSTGAWEKLILKDARETRGVLARNFAQFYTRGQAAWWMDLLGEGWYDDPQIWELLGKFHAFYQSSMDRREPYRPEIAVIVDEESCLDFSPAAGVQRLLLGEFRLQWYRIGAPVGIYLMSDLVDGKVPSAKFYIILNAFRLTDGQLAAVRKHTGVGSTVLWMFAPGITDGSKIDPLRIGGITGIATGETGKGDGKIVFGAGQSFPAGYGPIKPAFAVSDPEATPLAWYADGGEVAIASKKQDGRTDAFSAVLQVPAELLRTMARDAGVHLYSESNDVVMAGNGIVALHASSTGKKVIRLPRESAAEELLTGEKFPAAREFAFEMETGDTVILKLISS